MQEFAVSPNGERIATIVMTDDEAFTVCVNGELWTNRFEKAWSLRFSPAGILFCIGMNNDEWTVIQEDQPWEETFDYVWNMKFSADGSGVGVNIRTPDGYAVALNGITWGNKFVQMRSLEVSPDGRRAAGSIQLESLSEGDIFSFRKGLWSLAVDGETWGGHFLNVWDGAFSGDGTKIAAEVRLVSGAQTIAVNGAPWTTEFKAVWRPIFSPGSHDVVAPCLTKDGWRLLVNGKPLWSKSFNQVWHTVLALTALRSPLLSLQNSVDGL